MKPKISISIVSHAQGNLVGPLISDLIRHCRNEPIEVLLTLNIPENLPFRPEHQPFPLRILENASPLGFSANHNKASAEAKGTFFCVLNPDVRLRQNPYTQLLSFLENPNIGVIAPQVLNSAGENENNSRNFPTPFEIAGKLFGRTSAKQET
ncbi:glycosyltransferase, partial [Candidatus Saccharibacteria bacterium]|nr:glycosyltransferase [Candidatus Saccharibacteria bacterium]NIW78142.1 glycosyltransferase [Calditrichia bacterium]